MWSSRTTAIAFHCKIKVPKINTHFFFLVKKVLLHQRKKKIYA